MGCWSSSANSLTNTPTNFPFFMIDFSDRHVLNVMLADCRAVSVVSSAVAKMWPSGVEQETRLGRGFYEIRFFDNLFEREAYHVCCILLKRVMCKIFMDLYQIGWQPLVASSLTVHSKLSTWFFYKLKYKTVSKAVICISLTGSDRLQLINGSEEMKKLLKKAVLAIYLYGFSQEMTYGDDYEIKLKGKPWNSCVFDENVTAKRLILEIVRLFSQSGYQLYNTSNMTGSTCCMFFVQRRSTRILKHVEYFLIQLYYSNQIRLIGATDQNVQDVQKALEASCTFSFEKKDLLITTQFTLNAGLWSTSKTKPTKMTNCNGGKNEFEDMNTFLCKFFENLSSLGWRIVSSLSASQHLDDKCLFVLRSCDPSSIKHCMINLSDKNQLNLPISEHYAEIKKILKSFGISETKNFNTNYANHIMKHVPWIITQRHKRFVIRSMLCHIIKSMMTTSTVSRCDHGDQNIEEPHYSAITWKLICAFDLYPRFSPGAKDWIGKFVSFRALYPFGLEHNWLFVKVEGPPAASGLEEEVTVVQPKPSILTINANPDIELQYDQEVLL